MGRLLVGTASWTDPTLIDAGTFYPRWANTPEERLVFYSRQFPLVEVDSTYYSLPSERNSNLWVLRTPAGFTFDVKSFRLFTQHPTPPRSLPREVRMALGAEAQEKANVYLKDVPAEVVEGVWTRFREALAPLQRAGKLGLLLFQFPAWFARRRDNLDHILWCREHAGDMPAAVEFRSSTWLREPYREDTLRFLREHGLAYVCVDEPQGFASSVPPLAVATADPAVVRFHGRNRETWEKRGITASERFRYLYQPEELVEWVPRLRELADQTREVHVLMNNCYRDYAVVNGRQLSLLLEGASPTEAMSAGPVRWEGA